MSQSEAQHEVSLVQRPSKHDRKPAPKHPKNGYVIDREIDVWCCFKKGLHLQMCS